MVALRASEAEQGLRPHEFGPAAEDRLTRCGTPATDRFPVSGPVPLPRTGARHAGADMDCVREALNRSTACAVIETFLHANADAPTRADRPLGRLSVQGGLAEGGDSGRIAEFLAGSRRTGERGDLRAIRVRGPADPAR